MKEILLVAPYEQMYESARRILRDTKYRSVEVVSGNLAEGLALAINGVESHARVIISRGGTYRLIKQANIGIPVVEIRSSPFDVIESLSAAMEKGRPLAIVGYSNINNYDEKFLRKLVKTKLTIVNLGETDDVRQVVSNCAAQGYTMFLGDAVVKNVCDEAGYDCYLQESGSSAIQAAMDEALRICMVLKQEIELARRLRAVIDFVHDGVITVDGQGMVILFNAIACNLLGVKQERILGESIDTLSDLPFLRGMKGGDQIVDQTFKIGSRLLSVSTIPVFMENDSFGSVVIIRDIQELQAYEQKLRVALSDKGFVARHTFESIVHGSGEIAHCISIAKKFSHYNASILIEGESGVGKELFAQSIHNYGIHRNGPFVAVNCAVLPKSLIESELFGYVEGAFTGSRKGGKAGYFELAHKGTLFLDEIGELPLDVQAQLLRVVQEKEVMRLGDTKILPVEVRLICATNKNLIEMVHQGLFRKDLLFRINTLSLYIPPLAKRREDIELLAAHFLALFCKTYNKAIGGFSPKAAAYLHTYHYEGNVREFSGMIERAVIICEENMIRLSDLQSGLREDGGIPEFGSYPFPIPVDLDDMEKNHIRRILADNGHSMTKTAAALGISRSTLWRKIQSFNI
ncbi:sigma 54-interacting transcriptional regulator [Treponema primitia]|uniref:sigma 54-interacting transcriptional regulator n=1 Tax=Treponema primitia TaxID=88058 RepID=UPI000255573D|nr:sigma 54-interacting transcriptional regulator [Treponema primitia]